MVAGGAVLSFPWAKVDGNFFELDEGGCGDSFGDGLELLADELDGAREFRLVDPFMYENCPSEMSLGLVVRRRRKLGMSIGAKDGGGGVSEFDQGIFLVWVESLDQLGICDGLVDLKGRF